MGDDGAVTNAPNPGPDSTPGAPEAPDPRADATPVADAAAGSRPKRPKRGLLAATVLLVALIDQVTKVIAVSRLEGRPPVDVLGEWFQLVLLRNPGAAFSMGTDSTWLFTTIQIVFIVAVAVGSKYLRTPLAAVSAGLIAGGALGNLIDRLFREPSFYFGHVVDFLSVRGFAVFNVADAAITVGVVLLAAWIMFSPEVDEIADGRKKDRDKDREGVADDA